MGLLIKLFIGIILTAISYMAIPLIALLINNGRFEEKHAKRIALWNSVILGVIFCIITINLSDTNATWNAAPAILYYGINCALLTKKGKKRKDDTHASESTMPSPDCTAPEYSEHTEPKPIEHLPKRSSPKRKYCSRCGKLVNHRTKKCTGCGKQYLKGFSIKDTLFIILSAALIASLIGNIHLYSLNTQINERNSELADQVVALKQKNRTNSEKVQFIDNYIVFVEDDGTNRYHKYECSKFIGNYFWAFNTESAVGNGYKPCPLCCD